MSQRLTSLESRFDRIDGQFDSLSPNATPALTDLEARLNKSALFILPDGASPGDLLYWTGDKWKPSSPFKLQTIRFFDRIQHKNEDIEYEIYDETKNPAHQWPEELSSPNLDTQEDADLHTYYWSACWHRCCKGSYHSAY